MIKAEEEAKVTPVADSKLPPEFKKFDRPFGLEQHVFNILYYGIVPHTAAAYWFLYLLPMGYVNWWSFLYWFLVGYATSFGTPVGAHRYWTHRTFKAKLPLQILLMLMQTSQMQYPILKWCRDHRVHHKYTDTNADPHSAKRGFWFSHVLWVFLPKHPDCVKALKIVDISDLARDPVVRFQSKHYWELVLLVGFAQIYPCHILFPEMTLMALITGLMGRVFVSLHASSLVNSVAHKWGNKPYDKDFTSTDNKLVSLISVGEGWHNYHHTFPWDYQASEYGIHINLSTVFIHFFAKIGWAYDLKTVSHKMLVDRINRTGNGTHPFHCHNKEILDKGDTSYSACWGWGDDNLKSVDMEITETRYPSNKSHGS